MILYKEKGEIAFDVNPPIRLYSILKEKAPDVLRNYCGILMDGMFVDFLTPVPDGEYKLVPINSKEGLSVLWHTASHVLAQAVLRHFPRAKPTIGPAIDRGFYYDFYIEEPFTPEQLTLIEEEMEKIVREGYGITREEIGKDEALELFKDNKFKVELIKEIEGETVTVYKQGEFVDLCRGPHLVNTKLVGNVKVLTSSGSYWRGDERREALQRIYGIAYPEKKQLKEYIRKFEEAKKYDHRVLGKQLDIFSVFKETGPGLVYWHPNGAIIRHEIEDFWIKEHIKRGYQLVYTPHIARSELWNISGHLEFYRENMYLFQLDDEDYVVKPMNCPGHILIYKTKVRSYRELPIRYAELGAVYRYERSGVLHGLLRVRGFTQDDGHIFCTPEQLEKEILEVLDFVIYMMGVFGYKDFKIYLSVRDPLHKEKFAGSDDEWEQAEASLKKALEKRGYDYEIEEGGAVFYGPKIDIKLLDAIGREWQGPTIQFDFNLPRRFNVEYVGEDGNRHMVYMIHRALLGSMERFIGGLIEFYKGYFPLWLAPVQVAVLTVTSDGDEWAEEVYKRLLSEGIRVKLDIRNEKIGKKIRESEVAKIPYMVIIGKKEVENKNLSIRKHKRGDIGKMEVPVFIDMLKEEIAKKEVPDSEVV